MRYTIITLFMLSSFWIRAQQVSSKVEEDLLNAEMKFWHCESDSQRFVVLFEKAKFCRQNAIYNKALEEIGRAFAFCHNRIDSTALDYERMFDLFLSGQYDLCSAYHISPYNIAAIAKTNEFMTMRLMALNETERWQECKNELLNLFNTDSIKQKAIDSLPLCYDQISPEMCRRYSAWLPGLGQTAAGKPGKGALSFLIQAGLVTFIVVNVYTGFYITAAVTGALPLLKFYAGGKRQSAILAEQENEKEKNALKSRYKIAIMNNISQ